MPRDEDYEDEEDEEEDDSTTLQDIKDVADTVKSIADAANSVKKFTETSTPRPPNPPPSPNLGTGSELDKAIRDAKKQSVNRAFLRGSTKSSSQTPPKQKEKKEWGNKNLFKRFGKWIAGAIAFLFIAYIFWTFVAPNLPKDWPF